MSQVGKARKQVFRLAVRVGLEGGCGIRRPVRYGFPLLRWAQVIVSSS